MAETVTNLKVRFGADTKNFKADIESGKAAVDKFAGGAKDAFSEFASVFGVNMGEVSKQFSSIQKSLGLLTGGFKGAAAGSGFFTSALKILKLALISTGIGALVVALGSLITFFTRSSEGAEKVKVALAAVGGAFNVVMDRVMTFGKAIYQVFTGDFKGAGESITAAFSGFTEELKKEVTLAQKLKREIINLEKESKLFEAEQAAGQTKILALREKAKDIDLKPIERLKALREANAIEERLAEKSLDLAEREQAAALDQIDAKTGKLKLDEKALAVIEQIKSGLLEAEEAQRAIDELDMSDAEAKEDMFNLVDKIVNRENEQQNIIQTRLRLQKAENTLRKEILAQEIEGIKAVAELKEQQLLDDKKTNSEKIKLLSESIELQKKALRKDFEANNISYDKYISELDKLEIKFKETRKAIEENSLSEFWANEGKKIQPIKKLKQEITYTDQKTGKQVTQEVKLKIVTDSKGKPAIIKDFDNLFETTKLEAKAAKIQSIYGDLKSTLIDFSQAFNESMNSIAVGFGESLGNMLAGSGTLSDIGKVVLTGLADLAINVGKIAIGVGIATLGIKKALETLNPFVAIAAGIALVALGTAAKSALSGAASGGSYSASAATTSYGAGTTGSGAGSNYRSAPQTIYITGEFRQRGTDLVAVIDKNTQRRVIGT